jgi:hypothetical protein
LINLNTGDVVMNGIYDRLYRRLFNLIAQFHPQTATQLHGIKRQFGIHAAYHASSIILALQARMRLCGVEAVGMLTEDDLEEFTYFKLMAGNTPALELLIDMLECHAAECQSPQSQVSRLELRDPYSILA